MSFLRDKCVPRVLAILTICIPVFYNGCGSSYSAKQAAQQASNTPSEEQPPTPPPPPTLPGQQKSVHLAIGSGGLRMLSSDGFMTVDSKTIDISGTLNLITPPNCMDASAQVIGNRCCYQDQWSCYTSNGHSDFHLRGIAYGNGKFIAVGGAGFGISRTSVDGNTWSDRALWITGNSFIKQGKTNPSFITTVLFHQGEFIAMAGFGAFLYHSTDGINWYNQSVDIGGVFGNLVNTGSGFFATGQAGAWAFSKNGKTWDMIGTHPDQLRLFDPSSDGQILLVRESYTGGQTKFIRKNADNSGGWSYGQTLSDNISQLMYSPLSQKFHAYAAGKVYTSTDGSQWQSQTVNVSSAFQSVYYVNGHYFAQMYNWQTAESKIYRSSDGINWALISGDGPGQGQNILKFFQTMIP